MKSLPFDFTERTQMLERAATGLSDLITWAQEPSASKMFPKSATWTHEACRAELNMAGEGTLDDLILLYRTFDDVAAVAAHVHADKVQPFTHFKAGGVHVALQWGIFTAPLPVMHDRDATYLEASKTFIDAMGRRGFARYITSYPLGSMGEGYVRVDIRSWGVVLIETTDANVIHASTIVDVDWKGHITTCTATHMTSRLAQSIKHLPATLHASKKNAAERLHPCHVCGKPLCESCKGISNRMSGSSACLACACHMKRDADHAARATAVSDASTVESDPLHDDELSFLHSPAPLDLSYLALSD
ncbi:hypothetical protein ACHHYP_10284 [Achlya hypogyna]|uniref:START domain-containing protein n=1 Tax=Achlya hypogyna TaxID=1202772 RepID=A0A1V9YLX5_ACHHY|nr:hypothetical protein ACHHYP_10284 [Achlya hypogyna]